MARWLAALVAVFLLTSGPWAMAEQDDPRLDALFAQLHDAADEGEARGVEARIWAIWMEAPDSSTQLALNVGTQAMNRGVFDSALINFNMVIERDDGFAEGWNKRATLYFLMGDYEASLRDIVETLAREPRHFGALSGLGLAYLRMENEAAALDAFKRALAVHPYLPAAQHHVRTLDEKLNGIRT